MTVPQLLPNRSCLLDARARLVEPPLEHEEAADAAVGALRRYRALGAADLRFDRQDGGINGCRPPHQGGTMRRARLPLPWQLPGSKLDQRAGALDGVLGAVPWGLGALTPRLWRA